ncbi:hypothetical protein J0J21_23195, partial [Vibrio vulnificus]|uniref:hypothetical protein n=1 Tax=Vibrio vulnificus TaxID=672 RepID=UPI0019D41AE9
LMAHSCNEFEVTKSISYDELNDAFDELHAEFKKGLRHKKTPLNYRQNIDLALELHFGANRHLTFIAVYQKSALYQLLPLTVLNS